MDLLTIVIQQMEIFTFLLLFWGLVLLNRSYMQLKIHPLNRNLIILLNLLFIFCYILFGHYYHSAIREENLSQWEKNDSTIILILGAISLCICLLLKRSMGIFFIFLLCILYCIPQVYLFTIFLPPAIILILTVSLFLRPKFLR